MKGWVRGTTRGMEEKQDGHLHDMLLVLVLCLLLVPAQYGLILGVCARRLLEEHSWAIECRRGGLGA